MAVMTEIKLCVIYFIITFLGRTIAWKTMLDEYLIDQNINDECLQQDTQRKENNFNPTNVRECREGIFVEPMRWMGGNILILSHDGSTQKINCGKCNSKVGKFGWLKSVSCGCGVMVAPPGFLIYISRVDRCTMLKNVEASI